MNRSQWKKEVKKALIDMDETQRSMADKLGLSRVYIRQVMCGYYKAPETEIAISQFCNVPMYEEEKNGQTD